MVIVEGMVVVFGLPRRKWSVIEWSRGLSDWSFRKRLVELIVRGTRI